MKLIIEDDEGRKTVVPFVREEITIGRQEGNTIRLTERNVSRRHARLLRVNGHVMVEDLGSYNGIRINGERVSGQTPIHDGDLIQIGDYDLAIQTEGQQPKDLVPSTQDVVQTRRNVPDEPETEADAPIISPTEVVDGEEDTSPSAKDAGRRQSTSVIRVSQLEAERSQRQLADLDPEEAPRLFVLNTELAGREFSCIRTELRLGRTDDNDISLDHRSLSRTHAKVVREDNGEWRVLDMQSANGVKVNGEPYAQATLRFGDVIELGHVKLKFLAPGEAFRFVPGAYDDNAPAAPKRGKLLPAVVAVVVVLGLIAGSLMLPPVRAALGMGGETPEPSPRTDAPKQPGPSSGKPGAEAPAPQEAGLEQKLQGARAAMEAREYERATDILESLQGAGGTRAREIEELLQQAKREAAARKDIAQAHKELAAGRPDQAGELLGKAEGTVAFARDLEAAKAKVEAARAEPGKTGGNVVPASGTAVDKASGGDGKVTAEKLFDEGTGYYKKKRYEEAAASFNRCLEVDPAFARCHMMLGSTSAKLRQPEVGAQHYRKFLELAPDDPKAPDVRRLLEQYDRSGR